MRLEAIKGVAGGTPRNGTCLGQTSPRQGWTCGNQTLLPRGEKGVLPQVLTLSPSPKGLLGPTGWGAIWVEAENAPQSPQSTRREADPQHSGCCPGDQVCRPLTAHQHTLRRGGPSPKSGASATNLQGLRRAHSLQGRLKSTPTSGCSLVLMGHSSATWSGPRQARAAPGPGRGGDAGTRCGPC